MVFYSFEIYEFFAILAPFTLLGGLIRNSNRKILPLGLSLVLVWIYFIQAASSPVPLRWLFVLGPIFAGLVIGLVLHAHTTLLKLQTLVGLLVSLAAFFGSIYSSVVSANNPEGSHEVFINRTVYSAINLIEFFIIFLLVMGIMRLLKRESKGLAVILGLSCLVIDTDIPFLSYTLIPIVCYAGVGYLAKRAGLAPVSLSKEVAAKLETHPPPKAGPLSRLKNWIKKLYAAVEPFLIVALFISNVNYVWAFQTISDRYGVVVSEPGWYLRYGADRSFGIALLGCTAISLGVMLGGLFVTQVEPAK